jgi:ligand-binding sensor domain-containing protein/two-component sensor histidine kinase
MALRAPRRIPRGAGIGRRTRPLGSVFLLALFAHASASAETLPFRRYGIRDGLAHDRVNAIYQDAQGYIWFATWEGLSRFDGERFTNYGTAQGIPNPLTNDVIDDRDGRLWVATHGGGIAVLTDDPDAVSHVSFRRAAAGGDTRSAGAARRPFAACRVGDTRESNEVWALAIDGDNRIWCTTRAGLYRSVGDVRRRNPAGSRGRSARDSYDGTGADSIGTHRFEPFPIDGGPVAPEVVFPDDRGSIWLVTDRELIRVRGDDVARWPRPAAADLPVGWPDLGSRTRGWTTVAGDRAVHFSPGAGDEEPGRWWAIPVDLGGATPSGVAAWDSSGALWVGTREGLIRRTPDSQTTYTTDHGLADTFIRTLAVDRDGGLWIGTHSGGLHRLAAEPIVSYTRVDGLDDPNVARIVESRDGRIYAATERRGIVEISGGRAHPISGSERPPFHNVQHALLQDRRGDWWVGTQTGLYRFDGPALQLERGRRFDDADGIPATIDVFGELYEDSDGSIWVASADNIAYRYDPSRSRPPYFDRLDLASAAPSSPPRLYLRDRAGTLWLAPFVGLWRLVDGRIERFTPGDGFPDPDANTRDLYEDSRGWLWIALRFSGVAVTKAPHAERPPFTTYGTVNGLVSDAVWSITEDLDGRIYLGTGRGLDQIDLSTGRIRSFTPAEGLAGDLVNACMRDSRGSIWVGTTGGISRIDPRAERGTHLPPPIFIARVTIAGEDVALPERGSRVVEGLALPAARNNLAVEHVGIGDSRGPLLYEWRLDGAEEAWSRPSSQRSVHYARLAPGLYRYMVRAMSADGLPSAEPAVVEFEILTPFWRQGWFLVVAGALAGALSFGAHRLRVRRVLAMERIRRQIATDLHDDIGSGLSQIAILSEVVKRGAEPKLQSTMDEVARLARSMRDAMSDIVWAIDPRKDRLADLVQRMRQTALNLLEVNGVRVDFEAPAEPELDRIGLTPDQRRQLLLIFKEALTNIARHASATHARVRIEPAGRRLRLAIVDDGRGFDPALGSDGHGLESFRLRAAALNGRLHVDSAPGRGTRVELVMALR